MKAKSFISLFFILSTLLLGGTIALCFIVDPFEIYRVSKWTRKMPEGRERYLNAGIINSYAGNSDYDFDSVLIGTSTALNFPHRAIPDTLGFKNTLKLPIAGSSVQEQALTLNHVLKHKNIKKVLWEVHTLYWSDKKDLGTYLAFPKYLFNQTILDDYNYVVNKDVLKLSINTLFSKSESDEFDPREYNSYNINKQDQKEFESFNSQINNERINQKISKTSFKNLIREYINVQKYFKPVVERYCNTERKFTLYFSPLSKLFYIHFVKKDDFHRMVKLRRHLLELTNKCKNFEIFAFDNNEDITANLGNYKDRVHYSYQVNLQLLKYISSKQYLLTPENIDSYEKNFFDRFFK